MNIEIIEPENIRAGAVTRNANRYLEKDYKYWDITTYWCII